MTGAEALDLLMARFGNRSDASLRANTLLEMKLVQRTKLERNPAMLPWFLFADDTTTWATTTSTETVSITNVLSFDEELGGIFVYDPDSTATDKWVSLVRKNFNALRQMPGANAEAMPEGFDIIGTNLYLRPIPDDIYTLRVIAYIAGALPADDSVETTWLLYASDVLLAATGVEVAGKHLRDDELVGRFNEELQGALARLARENAYRMSSMRNIVAGGTYDD